MLPTPYRVKWAFKGLGLLETLVRVAVLQLVTLSLLGISYSVILDQSHWHLLNFGCHGVLRWNIGRLNLHGLRRGHWGSVLRKLIFGCCTCFFESSETLLQTVQTLPQVLVHILRHLHLSLQLLKVLDRALVSSLNMWLFSIICCLLRGILPLVIRWPLTQHAFAHCVLRQTLLLTFAKLRLVL